MTRSGGPGAPEQAGGRIGWTQVASMLAIVSVGSLPALLGSSAIGSAATLYPLATSSNPYFVPHQAWLLYVSAPIVALSACVLFLSPGLFLGLILRAGTSVGRWVPWSLALSIVAVSAVAGAVQTSLGIPLRNGAFAATVAVTALISCALLAWRVSRDRTIPWPVFGRQERIMLGSMVLVPWGLLIALAPKFFWESFNGDGAHAYESARLLLTQPLPFWPRAAGDIAGFPGTTSMLFAFPASWFIRLFGPFEASARIPYLLYLSALFGIVVELARYGRRPFRLAPLMLVWLALVVYSVVMAYSATYNPYSADIALPATQDTLLIVCFLAFVLAFIEKSWGWLGLFLTLTFLSLPSGTLLVGLWLLATLFWRPRPWRAIAVTAGGLVGLLLVAAVLPHALDAAGIPPPGGEYSGLGILRRYAILQWSDWRRLIFVAVPSGIAPIVGLFAWRRQDRIARALTIVTLLYFLHFYAPLHIALHHFVPAMLLPLVVFWRVVPGEGWGRGVAPAAGTERQRPWLLSAVLAAGILALWMSLPRDATPFMQDRLVGAAIEDNFEGYDTSEPGAFRHSDLLSRLFPYDWDPRVPQESYGGSPISWFYYSHRATDPSLNPNYVLHPNTTPPPNEMRRVAMTAEASLYVRSDSVWAQHLSSRPPTPAGSPIFEIPRGMLLPSVPLQDGPRTLSMIDVVEAVGGEQLLKALGVRSHH